MVYTLIRKIHLYSALFLGTFLLMYAGSAFVIFLPDWFPDNPVTTVVEGEGPFAVPESTNWGVNKEAGGKVEAQYRRQYRIRGRYETFTRHDDGRFDLIYRRPGAEIRLRFFPDSDSLNVITKEYGFAHLMNRLHNFRWYEGGLPYQIWALFLDLAALAMILFAISGILLWHTLKARNRTMGWIVLGSGAAYTLGSIIFLMTAA